MLVEIDGTTIDTLSFAGEASVASILLGFLDHGATYRLGVAATNRVGLASAVAWSAPMIADKGAPSMDGAPLSAIIGADHATAEASPTRLVAATPRRYVAPWSRKPSRMLATLASPANDSVSMVVPSISTSTRLCRPPPPAPPPGS